MDALRLARYIISVLIYHYQNDVELSFWVISEVALHFYSFAHAMNVLRDNLQYSRKGISLTVQNVEKGPTVWIEKDDTERGRSEQVSDRNDVTRSTHR
jgi:hypothetical protein